MSFSIILVGTDALSALHCFNVVQAFVTRETLGSIEEGRLCRACLFRFWQFIIGFFERGDVAFLTLQIVV
jgi:hypothetical protein